MSIFTNENIAILFLLCVIGIVIYIIVNKEGLQFAPIFTSPPQSPKEELVEYFARNWTRLAPIFIKDNCDDENIPPEILQEFKDRFGHYFKNKSEDSDPVLKHYMQNTYERNFKMEIKEVCKTMLALKKFINDTHYPSLQLKDLAKEIDRLHSEHYPQAVFISVILDRLLQICNTFPEYNIDQIVNTHDLLTISVIFYLTVNE
jgi:hypothetical protein